jgi:hypothetical protein
VLEGATVTAASSKGVTVATTRSDAGGRYRLSGLPVGVYTVTVESRGMRSAVISAVPVRYAQETVLDVSLEVGAVQEQITVAADAVSLQTEAGHVSGLVHENRTRRAIATPRLRQYFPETLYWQPSLETDASGRAHMRFPLADSITTWKVQVIGSTADGKIGTAERELLAFQPFFVENSPPPVLTEGDEVALPVVARSYTAKAQSVSLELHAADWMAPVGPLRQEVQVPPSDAARAFFRVRAARSTHNGPVRVTARSAEESDAVLKPLAVHPDGEEIAITDSTLVERSAGLTLVVPGDAIPGSIEARVRLVPGLASQVLESVEAVLRRPYGCGEQTISSSYPSVFALRLLSGDAGGRAQDVQRARRYLDLGYRRLLDMQTVSGGFGYFREGAADLTLTAYALRFLSDAAPLAFVDGAVSARAIAAAQQALVRGQAADGSWPSPEGWVAADSGPRLTRRTALVARALARSLDAPRATSGEGRVTAKQAESHVTSIDAALRRAREYLKAKAEDLDDPYVIASYLLLPHTTGADEAEARLRSRLRALARAEMGASYWEIEGDTPFFSWGRPARIETTALAVQALARAADPADHALVDRGLALLLRDRDRYGIWWSGQATVNVLEALVSQIGSIVPRTAAETVEVLVNGTAAALAVPAGEGVASPVEIDISASVRPGENRIELRRAAGGERLSAQAVATTYVPWKGLAERRESGPRPPLDLDVRYETVETTVGSWVATTVTAERIGSAGYGMLLAEIGLPPGADVDRASLDEAVAKSGWTFPRYDILPDRVVAYLWPRAGGTTFTFRFRPRLAMRAATAPSTLDDYYNPEMPAVVAPVRFTVTEGRARGLHGT